MCASCRAAIVWEPAVRCAMCRRALTGLRSAPATRCLACRVRPPAYRGVTGVGAYRGLCRWTIQAVKTRGHQELLEPIAALLHARLQRDRVSVDGVVPVVGDRRRIRRRGFDPAERLAEHLALRLQRPLVLGALGRRKPAVPQSSLAGAARRTNLREVFAVPPSARKRIRGRRLLVVDDVISTGSTVDAAARALLSAGAAEVWVAVIADNVRGVGVD